MATIQVRIDDDIKAAADSLFSDLGLDTSTAVRMFIAASLAESGLPFSVKRHHNNAPALAVAEDSLQYHTVSDSFKSAGEIARHALVGFGNNVGKPFFSSSESEDIRREILRSLYGSIQDPTFVEPQEIEYQSPKSNKNPRAAMFGYLRGKYKIADDFDAPLDDFKEYME